MLEDDFARIAGVFERERDEAHHAAQEAQAAQARAEDVAANLQARLDDALRQLADSRAETVGLRELLVGRLLEAAAGRRELGQVGDVLREAARLIRS